MVLDHVGADHLNITMDMDQVWHMLESSVPPEITHYRTGTHPGAAWWLKTAICKQSDHLGIVQLWQAIQHANHGLVQITPHCWDWQGDLIPWACSVWVQQHRDVIVEHVEPDWIYHVVSVDISKDIWCEQLHTWLKSGHNRPMRKQDSATWHKWQHTIEYMHKWCSEPQVKLNRSQIRVITNAQDTSSSHNP